jgi:hypothetical protein
MKKIAIAAALSCSVAGTALAATSAQSGSSEPSAIGGVLSPDPADSLGVFRSPPSVNEVPPKTQAVIDEMANHNGVQLESVRKLRTSAVEGISLYAATGVREGNRLVCVLSVPDSEATLGAACNTADAAIKGNLTGAVIRPGQDTLLFQLVPDGHASPLTTADGKADVSNNLALATAAPGSHFSFDGPNGKIDSTAPTAPATDRP